MRFLSQTKACRMSLAEKGLLRFLLGSDHKILNSPLFLMLDYKKNNFKIQTMYWH